MKTKLRECFNSTPEEICKVYSWLGEIKPFNTQLTSVCNVDDYLQELLVRQHFGFIYLFLCRRFFFICFFTCLTDYKFRTLQQLSISVYQCVLRWQLHKIVVMSRDVKYIYVSLLFICFTHRAVLPRVTPHLGVDNSTSNARHD